MSTRTESISAIVAEAKRQGFFDPGKHPGLRLSQEELKELLRQLEKNKIPYGKPAGDEASEPQLAPAEARRVVDALRRGIPAADCMGCYSVGREVLMGRVGAELSTVTNRRSLVRFLNADIGQGKTHALYLLRELAFRHGFAVSIVTLSQNSCPLYDFMAVYHEIMWGLRTDDQRLKPALSNIIDRWMHDIQDLGAPRVREIVYKELPPHLRNVMAAYASASNLFRPDETKRQLVLKYLGGDPISQRDLRDLEIGVKLDSQNALEILSEVAATIRYIGFKGICILFDEAEAIHSFAYSAHRDQAYANLRQIIRKSQNFPHCYFVYATTPSFFENYSSASLVDASGQESLLELEPIRERDKATIGEKIAGIYRVATGVEYSPKVISAIEKAATVDGRIGDYVRQVIAILDEVRSQRGR